MVCMSATNGQPESTQLLRAYAVLKGSASSVPSVEPVRSHNIRAHIASPEVREQVRRRLEELGFTVTRVSPLSITVEASVEQFERIFHGRLGKVEHPEAPSAFWSWLDPPEVPEDLKDKVDTIVLPEPVKLVV